MPSWKKVIISGSNAALNSLTVTNGITGSLFGTASFATTALSSSFVTTASFAVSSSRAVSSSYALQAANATSATDSTNTTKILIEPTAGSAAQHYLIITPTGVGVNARAYNTSDQQYPLFYTPNNATLTSKYFSGEFQGALSGTASFAVSSSRAVSSSFATTALSASFATTASFLASTTNAFIQNGNSFGTTALLGTNDNQPLALETNGTTRMFISSSGDVGIGTSSPETKLQIEDVTKVLTNNVAGVAQGTLSLVSTDAQAANVGASLVFGGNYITGDPTRIAYAGITGRKSNSSSVNADGYLSFLTWRSTGLTEAMRVTSAGDVAIGTSTALLNATGRGSLTVNGSTDSILTLGNNGAYSGYLYADSTRVELSSQVQPIAFVTNGAERMRILSGGNVGIGTTSPTAKLHVWNGGIKATGFPSAGNPFTFLESNYNDSAVNVKFLNINPTNGLDADLGIQLMNSGGTISDVFTIKGSSGNVGIGTTTPTSGTLQVNGNVFATSFTGSLFGTASAATTLATSRTLWGQSFNGSANVTGNLTSVGDIEGASDMIVSCPGRLQLRTTVAQPIRFYPNSTLRWEINSDGEFISTGAQTIRTSTGNLKLASGAGNGKILLTPHGTGSVEITNGIFYSSSISTANVSGEIAYWGGGTVAAGTLYYYDSSGNWTAADADAESTSTGMLGIALAAGTASTVGILLRGHARFTGVSSFTGTTTVGAKLYVSATAGAFSQTAPTGTGDVVRIIGYVQSTANDQIYFCPDTTWVTLL
jgi:hypothetical protein